MIMTRFFALLMFLSFAAMGQSTSYDAVFQLIRAAKYDEAEPALRKLYEGRFHKPERLY
jgi:hypothetical protein